MYNMSEEKKKHRKSTHIWCAQSSGKKNRRIIIWSSYQHTQKDVKMHDEMEKNRIECV